MHKQLLLRIHPLLYVLVAVVLFAVAGYVYLFTDQKTVIKQGDIVPHVAQGRISVGDTRFAHVSSDAIRVTKPATYESPVIEPTNTSSNAAVVSWDEKKYPYDKSTDASRGEDI